MNTTEQQQLNIKRDVSKELALSREQVGAARELLAECKAQIDPAIAIHIDSAIAILRAELLEIMESSMPKPAPIKPKLSKKGAWYFSRRKHSRPTDEEKALFLEKRGYTFAVDKHTAFTREQAPDCLSAIKSAINFAFQMDQEFYSRNWYELTVKFYLPAENEKIRSKGKYVWFKIIRKTKTVSLTARRGHTELWEIELDRPESLSTKPFLTHVLTKEVVA